MKSNKNVTVFWFITMLCAVALVGFGFSPALADNDNGQGILEEEQDPGYPVYLNDGGADTEFGTGDGSFGQNNQATWIPSADFTPYNSTTAWGYGSPGMRYITGGSPWMDAGVRLPSGARLILVRIFYDDNHATQRVRFWIFKNRYNVSPFSFSTLVNSLQSPAGVSRYSSAFVNTAETITNAQYWYHARFRTEAAVGSATKFAGVRLFWHRQVRTGLPNPFGDIGGLNARFQNAIKAMADSGITGGCAPGLYCPDAPVTRGQFAVFFAEGLGLYWDFFDGY